MFTKRKSVDDSQDGDIALQTGQETRRNNQRRRLPNQPANSTQRDDNSILNQRNNHEDCYQQWYEPLLRNNSSADTSRENRQDRRNIVESRSEPSDITTTFIDALASNPRSTITDPDRAWAANLASPSPHELVDRPHDFDTLDTSLASGTAARNQFIDSMVTLWGNSLAASSVRPSTFERNSPPVAVSASYPSATPSSVATAATTSQTTVPSSEPEGNDTPTLSRQFLRCREIVAALTSITTIPTFLLSPRRQNAEGDYDEDESEQGAFLWRMPLIPRYTEQETLDTLESVLHSDETFHGLREDARARECNSTRQSWEKKSGRENRTRDGSSNKNIEEEEEASSTSTLSPQESDAYTTPNNGQEIKRKRMDTQDNYSSTKIAMTSAGPPTSKPKTPEVAAELARRAAIKAALDAFKARNGDLSANAGKTPLSEPSASACLAATTKTYCPLTGTFSASGRGSHTKIRKRFLPRDFHMEDEDDAFFPLKMSRKLDGEMEKGFSMTGGTLAYITW